MVEVDLPSFDAVVGNPPYVRSQQLDDLDVAYKETLKGIAAVQGVGRQTKLDAFAYFIIHAERFLEAGGRLGFVTSASWLTSQYGAVLQRFLLERFQPIAVVWSEVEPFFPTQDIDTIILVAKKLTESERDQPRGKIRFATLRVPLSQLVPATQGPGHWAEMDRLAGLLELSHGDETSDYRIVAIDGQLELDALRENPKVARNWGRQLLSSSLYADLFG